MNNDNGGDEFNPLTSFTSMLEDDNVNWCMPQHNHHEFPLDIDAILLAVNNEAGCLAEFDESVSYNPIVASNFTPDAQFPTSHLLQSPGNGFGSLEFPGLNPLEGLDSTEAHPTLYEKRADLRRNSGNTNGGGENLVILDEGVDVDDGSGKNYDSNDVTEATTNNVEENMIQIGGGSSSNGNMSSTIGGHSGKSRAGGYRKGKRRGLPAKNLTAERRRRSKLNEKLLHLRSLVPNITKMNRASILGDAIAYLKDLLWKIDELTKELESSSSTAPNVVVPAAATGFIPLTPTATTIPSCIKDIGFTTVVLSPTGQPIRIEVRQREGVVNIHMFCNRRPGLLITIMRTLDTLGLDIKQAVISCFNGLVLDIFRAEKRNQGVQPDQIKTMLLELSQCHGTT